MTQSIVTSYAGFVIEGAVEVLRNVEPKNKDSMQLWRRVVQTLQKTFEHDQDGIEKPPQDSSSDMADDLL